MWVPVVDMYIRDMHAIYDGIPALTSTLITYRGEPAAYYSPLLGLGNTSRRFISCSLDASVAAFFSRRQEATVFGKPQILCALLY